jgi:hypothetical protein
MAQRIVDLEREVAKQRDRASGWKQRAELAEFQRDSRRQSVTDRIEKAERENTELKLAVKLLREEVEEQRGWPTPAEPLEQTPPDAWGERP